MAAAKAVQGAAPKWLAEAQATLTGRWQALRDLPRSFDEYEWLALLGYAERDVRPTGYFSDGKPRGGRYYFRLLSV